MPSLIFFAHKTIENEQTKKEKKNKKKWMPSCALLALLSLLLSDSSVKAWDRTTQVACCCYSKVINLASEQGGGCCVHLESFNRTQSPVCLILARFFSGLIYVEFNPHFFFLYFSFSLYIYIHLISFFSFFLLEILSFSWRKRLTTNSILFNQPCLLKNSKPKYAESGQK